MNAQEKIDALNLNGKVRRAAMEVIGKDVIMGILQERGAAKILAEKLGFANSGALSVATGDLGWRGVSTRTGNGESENKESKVVVKRAAKCVLPAVTAAWAIAQLQGAWCALGNDPDEFDPPELTPEVFRNIPAFKAQRDGWLRHLAQKLGGLDSDAAKDFRAWLGVPLTAEQAEIENNEVNNGKKKLRMKELAYNVNRVNSLLQELGLDSTAIQGLVDLVARIGFMDDKGNLVI